MAKTTQIECLVEQTLVKNEAGKKIKVKKGEIFTTDSRTAEAYLKVYRGNFRLVSESPIVEGGEAPAVTDEEKLAYENRIEELEKQLEEEIAKSEKLEQENNELQVEIIKHKYEGVAVEDIDYNDLRKIATLKWLKFEGPPKKEDIIKAVTEALKPATPANPETPEVK